MAVSSQDIVNFLLANPGMSDAQIVSAMEQYGVSPAQMATAVGIPEAEVIARVAEVVPPNQAVLLGDTWVQPQYQITGSGEDQQVGPIESIQTYKTSGGVNDQVPVGTTIQNFTPEGEFTGSSKTTNSGQTSFVGGLVDALKDPVVLAALGGAAYGGLLGGVGTAAGGVAGMSAAELAQLDLALGGAGGTAGATSLGNALATGANVGTLTNLTGGSGLFGGADVTTNTARELAAANAAKAAGGTGALTTAGGAGALTTAGGTSGLLSTTLPAAGTVGGALTAGALSTLGGAATNKLLGDAVTGGLGLAGGLLQSGTSKEAAQTAAQNVNTATQQAVEASQFRPVGMTTRFGTSQFTYDPVTGRMITADYKLRQEAQAQQDRLAALANRGLTQAEQAQQQFAPLQTGAQNLFGLGNQYISQSPQDVAQNYINQQMQLLQPSREMELANLQNRLQQQGRAGLSVAQGGSLGATTPELQALYNARAQQELQLAANAQQAGQQNVLFGAGLLGQGAGAMGQYYSGQQAAYAPYTTALGQVQNLEAQAQQPLQMGAQLGQQAATAGANAGRIGVTGAQISGNLLTSPAVTNNPYAAFLGGLASPTSTLGQGISNWITGYNPTADQNAVVNPYFTPNVSVFGS
jgi:hypothetical protein